MVKISQIRDQNPWWHEKVKPMEAKMPKRFLYQEIEKQTKSRFVLGILGLRRVGKSTIMKQVIGKLLDEKIDSTRILYFSFDQKMIIKSSNALENILEKYFSEILEEKPSLLKKKVYIFIDEIQYIDFWQDIIKRYYDLSEKIKFFVTGSQSIILSGKSRESLAGRMFEFYLEPLCFDEFLMIAGKKTVRQIYLDDVFKIAKIFSKIEKENYIAGEKLQKDAQEYLLSGQFPEILKEKNIKNKYTYIKESVIGKILEKDIPKLYEVSKVDCLKIEAEHLIENSGSLFELNNISQEAGISRLTAESYLEYFKKGYLVDVLYRYSKSKIKKGRLFKKSYAHSVNFICALKNLENNFYNKIPEVFGGVAETFIFGVLRNKSEKYNYDLSFFRKGKKEIDFIVRSKNELLPIEVKFKENIRNSDFKFLVEYCLEKKIKNGIVVTKNLAEKKNINGVEIFFVPFYFF